VPGGALLMDLVTPPKEQLFTICAAESSLIAEKFRCFPTPRPLDARHTPPMRNLAPTARAYSKVRSPQQK